MDQGEISDKLEAQILTLSAKASSASNITAAREYAQAALYLAEARAWVLAPRQPHGGSAASSSD